jgi:CBS domain containing-hemolysin-like protein
MVHVKDVLRTVESEGTLDANITARDLSRDVLIVPENRLLDDILGDLQRNESQMAIVIDEWGSFEGLITVEDIIEEIVGDIRDEFDEEEPSVRRIGDGSYELDGRTPIAAANEALDAGFKSDDFDTVGGLVLGQLGRPPQIGDEVSLNGYTLRVDEVDGPRVAQVIVYSHSGEDPENGADEHPSRE